MKSPMQLLNELVEWWDDGSPEAAETIMRWTHTAALDQIEWEEAQALLNRKGDKAA